MQKKHTTASQKAQAFMLQMPPLLHAQVKARAALERQTMGALINRLLESELLQKSGKRAPL